MVAWGKRRIRSSTESFGEKTLPTIEFAVGRALKGLP